VCRYFEREASRLLISFRTSCARLRNRLVSVEKPEVDLRMSLIVVAMFFVTSITWKMFEASPTAATASIMKFESVSCCLKSERMSEFGARKPLPHHAVGHGSTRGAVYPVTDTWSRLTRTHCKYQVPVSDEARSTSVIGRTRCTSFLVQASSLSAWRTRRIVVKRTIVVSIRTLSHFKMPP
jgi:hypothetical protein